MVQEKNPAGLIKNIYIVGPRITSSPEIEALYNANKDWVMIGDGAADKPLIFQDIIDKIGDSSFAEMPVIYISAHGGRHNGKHTMDIDNSDPTLGCDTRDFLRKLNELVGGPMCVHILSCYGGSANKDAGALGEGSFLITHIEGKEQASMPLENIRLYSLLKRSCDTNLTPSQQFILGLQENFTATTLTKVELGGKTTQFKSTRVPKKAEMFDIVSEMKEHEHLKNFVNKFLGQEGARFQKIFQEEDVAKEIKIISELDDQDANRLLTGILFHLCDVKKNINIPLFEKFVNQLLSKGIDVNAGLDNTTRPLIKAIFHKKTKLAKVLIKTGKSLDLLNDNGSTALHLTLEMIPQGGGTDITKMLLDNGANPNVKNKDGNTVLHRANALGSKRNFRKIGNVIGKMLLNNGANPDIKNNDGDTALHIAVIANNSVMIKMLLNNKANPDIKNNDGNTALHLAAAEGNTAAGKILIDKGINVNVQNNAGNTALHWAIKKENIENIEMLLKYGASVDIRDIKLAQKQGNQELVTKLSNAQEVSSVRNQLIDYFCQEMENKQKIDPTHFNKMKEHVATTLQELSNKHMDKDIKTIAERIVGEAAKMAGKKLDLRHRITIIINKFLDILLNRGKSEFKDILNTPDAKKALKILNESGVKPIAESVLTNSLTTPNQERKKERKLL